MEGFRKVAEVLGRLDRRYVYLILLVAVVLPLILPVSFHAPALIA